LYASEIVTIGLMFTLKGGRFRAFYRWLNANYRAWFPKLPERSRLQRLLRDHAEDVLPFLADPSFFTVVDTYGIELIHPRREGRSRQQIGKKGKSNGRWIVGVKLAWLINNAGEVVDWAWLPANAGQSHINSSIYLAFFVFFCGKMGRLRRFWNQRSLPPCHHWRPHSSNILMILKMFGLIGIKNTCWSIFLCLPFVVSFVAQMDPQKSFRSQ